MARTASKPGSKTALSARDRILAAAVDLVLESGPTVFETKTVATKAEVSQPQINYYFGSRDGLLASVASTLLDSYIERVTQQVKASKNPREAVSNYVDEVIAFNKDHPDAGTLAFYPHLFAVRMEEWQQTGSKLHLLDSSEQLDLIRLSCMYAVHFGRPYRLIDRSRITNFHRAFPRVTTAAASLGLLLAGYSEELGLRSGQKVYGLDLDTLLRRCAMQIVDDLQSAPAEADEDESLFL